MLVDKNIIIILDQLSNGDTVHLPFGGLDILIKYYQGSKLAMMTPVYYGDNYIPGSVRKSLSQKPTPAAHPSIPTFLSVDEKSFSVSLNYLGHTNILDRQTFHHLIVEFAKIADKWRHYLDENDRQDLIHIKVR